MNAVATVTCSECGVYTVSIDGPYSFERCMAKLQEHADCKHDHVVHEESA